MPDAHANEQTKIIERDLEKLAARFDRHLEIYAQNGKELAALKSSVDSLRLWLERESSELDTNNVAQWKQIKINTDNISNIQIELGKLGVKIAAFAAIGATAASTIVVFGMEKVFM